MSQRTIDENRYNQLSNISLAGGQAYTQEQIAKHSADLQKQLFSSLELKSITEPHLMALAGKGYSGLSTKLKASPFAAYFKSLGKKIPSSVVQNTLDDLKNGPASAMRTAISSSINEGIGSLDKMTNLTGRVSGAIDNVRGEAANLVEGAQNSVNSIINSGKSTLSDTGALIRAGKEALTSAPEISKLPNTFDSSDFNFKDEIDSMRLGRAKAEGINIQRGVADEGFDTQGAKKLVRGFDEMNDPKWASWLDKVKATPQNGYAESFNTQGAKKLVGGFDNENVPKEAAGWLNEAKESSSSLGTASRSIEDMGKSTGSSWRLELPEEGGGPTAGEQFPVTVGDTPTIPKPSTSSLFDEPTDIAASKSTSIFEPAAENVVEDVAADVTPAVEDTAATVGEDVVGGLAAAATEAVAAPELDAIPILGDAAMLVAGLGGALATSLIHHPEDSMQAHVTRVMNSAQEFGS